MSSTVDARPRNVQYLEKLLSLPEVRNALEKAADSGVPISFVIHENTSPTIAELVRTGRAVCFYCPKPVHETGDRPGGPFMVTGGGYSEQFFNEPNADEGVVGCQFDRNFFESKGLENRFHLRRWYGTAILEFFKSIFGKEVERPCYYHVQPHQVYDLFKMIQAETSPEKICRYLGEENKVSSEREIRAVKADLASRL